MGVSKHHVKDFLVVAEESNITPRISIIVATHNYARYISETLENVAAQEFADWECIVIDDGSTDETVNVVAKFVERDARFCLIKQSHRGVAAARNAGLAKARGMYVQFQDADDLLETSKLSEQAKFLDLHAEVDVVYGAARYFTNDALNERRFSLHERDRRWMPETEGAGAKICCEFARRNILPINTPLTRRAVIESIGGFDERLASFEDLDLFMRIAATDKRFAFYDKANTRALIRAHAESLSKNNAQMLASEIQMRTKWQHELGLFDEARSINTEMLAQLRGRTGVMLVVDGARGHGAHEMLKAARASLAWHRKAKWLALSLLAPLAPRDLMLKLADVSLARTERDGATSKSANKR